MFDPKWIRDNPATFDAGRAQRGLPPLAAIVIELDTKRRATQTAWQEMQARRNELSKQVGQLKAKGDDAAAVMAEVASLKDRMVAAEAEELKASEELEALLAQQPNLPAQDVPKRPIGSSGKSATGATSPFRRSSISRSVKRWARWISPLPPRYPVRASWC